MQITFPCTSSSRRFLPPNVRLFRNPVDDDRRFETSMAGGYKPLSTLLDRDVAVITNVNLTRCILPHSMEALDRYDLVRNFVLAEKVRIKELQAAINSTVRIPGISLEEGGSGIVLNHGGKKYLLTALHLSSVQNLICGYRNNMPVYFKEKEYLVNKVDLIYPEVDENKKIIPSGNIPLADIAVFEYHGECEGISLGKKENFIEPLPLFTIGYPSGERKYSKDPLPLVGFGFAVPEKSTVQNIDGVQKLFGVSEDYPQIRKWFYTGAALPGNSGCGLVDLNGRLRAILCGLYKNNSDVTGFTTVFSLNDIFKTIPHRLAA